MKRLTNINCSEKRNLPQKTAQVSWEKEEGLLMMLRFLEKKHHSFQVISQPKRTKNDLKNNLFGLSDLAEYTR